MKILIAYDDSDCSRAALEDLPNAGLPADTQALVLMVTENWSLMIEAEEREMSPERRAEYRISEEIERIRERAHAAFAETEKFAQTVAERLRADFPSWRVEGAALAGFPHWGVPAKAREWGPDLIVVGAHGRSLIGRLLLGSTSLKILTEAPCSVRVARRSPARTPDDDSPERLIVGFDGSPDALLAARAVARRSWRQHSAVRLVTALEPILAATAGFDFDLQAIREARQSEARRLEAAGLHVSTIERVGAAKKVLLEEADRWGADAIFIGARGHRLMERMLLGSVSYSVAAGARCAVEIVRPPGD